MAALSVTAAIAGIAAPARAGTTDPLASLDFGKQAQYVQSAPLQVRLTLDAGMYLVDPVVSDIPSGEGVQAALDVSGCQGVVGPAACAVDVRYTALVAGSTSDRLGFFEYSPTTGQRKGVGGPLLVLGDAHAGGTSTTLTLTTTPDDPEAGEPITATAVVRPDFGTGTPTGEVRFLFDGAVLADVPLVNGTATSPAVQPSPGRHYFVGNFYSNFRYIDSSPTLWEYIWVPRFRSVLTAQTVYIAANQSIRPVATLTTSDGAPLAGRTVQFLDRDRNSLCYAVTDAAGKVTCDPNVLPSFTAIATTKYYAEFYGDELYTPAKAEGTIRAI